MNIDILICSLNKGIVRVQDVLLPPTPNIKYIISFQYTEDRYLDLIPASVVNRTDVVLHKYKGQGLSANRNLALEHAESDLVIFADDDTHLSENILEVAEEAFAKVPNMDVAFFTASTYTGKPLKEYPQEEFEMKELPENYAISTIEMIAKRESIQGKVRFDERFGLGTKFLTCGEEEIWMHDALKAGLKIYYFPKKIIETSTLLKKSHIYVDAGVQRSRGAITYYIYGKKAWWHCFSFALKSARNGMCHFIPMFKHLAEGIRYMQRTKA
jgi:glycosyltransferase involved in cell wall biosynthesis